ncbi:MAG: hypothetical protein LKJ17_08285 [Oscillospiraceae bacterium]|jgi:hypothetical protein|nr:hypothetical protein [Oscillospiraceae bacterium]
MRKFVFLPLIFLLCTVLAAGCGSRNTDKESLPAGTYLAQDGANEMVDRACLELSGDGTFTFTRHLYDDTIRYGSYQVQNGALILHDDGGKKYVFQVADQSLTFQKDASSDLQLDDLTEFRFQPDDAPEKDASSLSHVPFPAVQSLKQAV